VVLHICNPLERLKEEDYEFEVSLGYTVGPFLKTNKPKTQTLPIPLYLSHW
jgi:hypothetical protein